MGQDESSAGAGASERPGGGTQVRRADGPRAAALPGLCARWDGGEVMRSELGGAPGLWLGRGAAGGTSPSSQRSLELKCIGAWGRTGPTEANFHSLICEQHRGVRLRKLGGGKPGLVCLALFLRVADVVGASSASLLFACSEGGAKPGSYCWVS